MAVAVVGLAGAAEEEEEEEEEEGYFRGGGGIVVRHQCRLHIVTIYFIVLEQVEGPDIREMMVFFCHSDTYYITYLVSTYQRRSI
jgi:hypothetical protein